MRVVSVQIDKLMRGRADILAPVAIGNKRVRGTCVDYAYHMYNLVSADVDSIRCR